MSPICSDIEVMETRHALENMIVDMSIDMNARDTDKATIKNNYGWSKPHSKFFHDIENNQLLIKRDRVKITALCYIRKYWRQFDEMGYSLSRLNDLAKKSKLQGVQ